MLRPRPGRCMSGALGSPIPSRNCLPWYGCLFAKKGLCRVTPREVASMSAAEPPERLPHICVSEHFLFLLCTPFVRCDVDRGMPRSFLNQDATG
jgi:hypothetical protein